EAYKIVHTQAEAIAVLEQVISDFNGDVIDVPFPLWSKSLDSKIWYVNHPYEVMILDKIDCPRDSLIGNRGEKCFPLETIEIFISNDKKVLENPYDLIIEVEKIYEEPGISFKWLSYEGKQPHLMGMWIPLKDIWQKIEGKGEQQSDSTALEQVLNTRHLAHWQIK
ncbi:MAG: hypothetical protein AAF599_05380, partial [Bacteroidota bacterium]